MSETTAGIYQHRPEMTTATGETTIGIQPLHGDWCGTNRPTADLEVTLNNLLGELQDLFLERHRAYGPSNIVASGIHGVVVRMSDKLARITHAHEGCSLGFCRPHASSQAWEDLMVEDAWKDLANYAIIGLLVQRGLWPDS
jgi:hypothetical protein